MNNYILKPDRIAKEFEDDPSSVRGIAARLTYCGRNTGNLVYYKGIESVLSDDIPVADWFNVPKDADNLILPAANQLGRHTNLGAIAKLWEGLDKNVVTIGLGVQCRTVQDLIITDGTRKWLDFLVKKAAGKKSFLGVRGKTTEKIINDIYGYEAAKVCGCPSQFISTPEFILSNIKNRLDKPLLSLSVNSAEPGLRMFDKYTTALINEIIKYDGSYMLQAPEHSLVRILRKSVDADLSEGRLDFDPNDLYNIDCSNFFRNKATAFFNMGEWEDMLHRYDYNIGFRIHGTMFSLACGVPSFLINVDERTREFAETMMLPYTEDYKISDIVGYAKERMINHDYEGMLKKWKSNAQMFRQLMETNEIALSKQFLTFWCN
jgi:hypothetical protein